MPPSLLVVVGLVVALVAGGLLVARLLGADTDDGSVSAPTVTSTPEASTSWRTAESGARASQTPDADTAPTSAATWITISSAGLEDEPLSPEGLAPDGTINPQQGSVIWFTGNDRVEPGHPGTSVIAGHVTWEKVPDVFYQLPQVEVGDTVEVGYADGTSRTFTVTSAGIEDKQSLARSRTVWGEQPDTPRLAIITCDDELGFLDDGHAVANFVVIAEA